MNLSQLCKPLFTAVLATIAFSAAVAEVPAGYDVQSSEAPELGVAGEYVVGTKDRTITLPGRVVLTSVGPTGSERSIGLRIWYPAASTGARARAVYRHSMKTPTNPASEILEQGTAFENAIPAKGKFPLVIMSHGFMGWSEHLSRLGEHLASRGYVVASIDHQDMSFDSLPGFLLSFGNVLSSRSLDQRLMIQRIVSPGFAKEEPVLASVDKSRIGLIGYSMGGFGALATAGAAYDAEAEPFAALPTSAKEQVMQTLPVANVQALVLIAPWGGQPDNRAWRDGALATVTTPTLFISGNQDDIVNHNDGVRWMFDRMTGADRYLLVYRDARHNIAGNPVDLGESPAFDAIGYAREPVWRQERLNQINQHFITAFLDSTLKKDQTRRRYLDVPTPIASHGKWPAAFGQTDDGAYAGDGQPEYWRGFQRRWATGIELHRRSANKQGKQ